jgi:tetratricopeptide (TPR) repeat protein
MIFLKIFAGIIFFFLGLIYLYKSDLVLSLNRIAREIIFSDRIILLKRKKLAILFFCLSFIALYMGFTSLANVLVDENEKRLSGLRVDHLMYTAMQDFCIGKFEKALEKYKTVLKTDPGNIEALKRIAYTYLAAGDKTKANQTWQRLSRLVPNDKEIKGNLKEFSK